MSFKAQLYMGFYSLFHMSHGPSLSSDPGMDSAIGSAEATNENLHFLDLEPILLAEARTTAFKGLFVGRGGSGTPLLKWNQVFFG